MGWFSKPTQEKLDANFLKAVSQLRLSRATKILKQGANPCAVDAGGNTALHLLAAADPRADKADTSGMWLRTRPLDNFLPLILKAGVDPAAFNKAGMNFLHVSAANKADHGDVLGRLLHHAGYQNVPTQDSTRCYPIHFAQRVAVAAVLVNAGADPMQQNAAGKTLLHDVLDGDTVDEEFATYLIKVSPESLMLQDYAGRVPNVRVAGYGHLRRHIDSVRQKTAEKDHADTAVQAREETIAANAGWVLLADTQVARVKNEKELGYKLTEIFNFSTRTYTVLSCNLDTKGEGVSVKDFDAFADKTLLQEAWRRLIALDGCADESVIYRQRIDKGGNRLPGLGEG